MMSDDDGKMIFGDLVGLKLPDICLTGEQKTPKNLTQETCPARGSNPGPLRDRRACYHLVHSGGLGDLGIAPGETDCQLRQKLLKVLLPWLRMLDAMHRNSNFSNNFWSKWPSTSPRRNS